MPGHGCQHGAVLLPGEASWNSQAVQQGLEGVQLARDDYQPGGQIQGAPALGAVNDLM